MSKPQAHQDFKHHARFDPAFHFIGSFVLVANLAVVSLHLWHHFSRWNVWLLVVSVGLFVPYFLIRVYSLKVQDRVIRLEERLRLKELAPAAWHPQIAQLSEDQLIALRFASDEEVVSLAGQALGENLNRKQIKERIKNWRPDHWRV